MHHAVPLEPRLIPESLGHDSDTKMAFTRGASTRMAMVLTGLIHHAQFNRPESCIELCRYFLSDRTQGHDDWVNTKRWLDANGMTILMGQMKLDSKYFDKI